MRPLNRRMENGNREYGGSVVFLKERNFFMIKNDIVFKNPLRSLGHESEDILAPGDFGAVLARAGIGKTSILVQLAIDSMLRSENVLHISLGDPVKKVCLWYDEVLRNIAGRRDAKEIDRLKDAMLPRRLIMTFNADGFSTLKLKERLEDLVVQDIFKPKVLLIDGIRFEENMENELSLMKTLAENHSMQVWFSVRIHRHEATNDDEIPLPLKNVADMFEIIFQLSPERKNIHLKVLKDIKTDESPDSKHPSLLLDPATMLVTDGGGSS